MNNDDMNDIKKKKKNIKKKENEKPKITGAADLIHLNAEQRIGFLGGNQNWVTRRNFLKGLLGSAAFAAIALSIGCPPSITDSGSSSDDDDDGDDDDDNGNDSEELLVKDSWKNDRCLNVK